MSMRKIRSSALLALILNLHTFWIELDSSTIKTFNFIYIFLFHTHLELSTIGHAISARFNLRTKSYTFHFTKTACVVLKIKLFSSNSGLKIYSTKRWFINGCGDHIYMTTNKLLTRKIENTLIIYCHLPTFIFIGLFLVELFLISAQHSKTYFFKMTFNRYHNYKLLISMLYD